MKFHQVRYLCQIVDSGFNVTVAAKSLFTSQSGVSRQVRLLERELGVDVLIRQGNRILGLTEPGKEIIAAARNVLLSVRDLKSVGASFEATNSGRLAIATSHLHARYSLQPTISAFCQKFPNVQLRVDQLFPAEIADVVAEDEADIGITAGPEQPDKRIVMLPAYSVSMSLIVTPRHPLTKIKKPSLEDIANFPLIVLDPKLSSGWTVARMFEKHGIAPNIVMSATDADVIKEYVRAGLGISLLRSLAFRKDEDRGLAEIPVNHIFPSSMTHILLRHDKYLRPYMYEFIEMISSKWTAARVKQRLSKS